MVSAYVDDQLDQASAGRVARHLRECWWCSEDAEFTLLVKQSLSRSREQHIDLGVARVRHWVAQL